MNDKIKLSKSHPYLAVLNLDPAQLYDFERLSENRPEVKICTIDQSEPDSWTIYLACASQAVVDKLEANW